MGTAVRRPAAPVLPPRFLSNMRLGNIALAVSLTILAASRSFGQEQAQNGILPRIDSVARAEMARQKIPGVAVAVIRHGEVVSAKGYGEANVELHVPVTPETVFESGSVGKQFTSTA